MLKNKILLNRALQSYEGTITNVDNALIKCFVTCFVLSADAFQFSIEWRLKFVTFSRNLISFRSIFFRNVKTRENKVPYFLLLKINTREIWVCHLREIKSTREN